MRKVFARFQLFKLSQQGRPNVGISQETQGDHQPIHGAKGVVFLAMIREIITIVAIEPFLGSNPYKSFTVLDESGYTVL